MKTLNVNPKYRDFLPPLTTDERKALRESIRELGGIKRRIETVIDPVNGETIIDGHNRYELCTELGIDIGETVILPFTDESDIYKYIASNQKSQRNLNTYQLGALELKLQAVLKDIGWHHVRMNGGDKSSPEAKAARDNLPAPLKPHGTRGDEDNKTNAIIADNIGVSRRTVDRIAFIEMKATPEQKIDLAYNRVSINKVYTDLRQIEDPEYGVTKPEATPNLEKELESWGKLNDIISSDIGTENSFNNVMIDIMGLDASDVLKLPEPARTRALMAVIASMNHLNDIIVDIRKAIGERSEPLEIT